MLEFTAYLYLNTNGTFLKSVSKSPTFRFFRDFQLFQHPAKLAKLRPNLGQNWPKRAVFEKMLKTPIFGHFGRKRLILDHFCPKRSHFLIFGEKAKTSLFYSFFSFFNTKNQKIIMRGFSGKWACTNERTYERTNERR